jgi:hypothetical protein
MSALLEQPPLFSDGSDGPAGADGPDVPAGADAPPPDEHAAPARTPVHPEAAPARTPVHPEAAPARTLEDVIAGTWDSLLAGAAADCPVCGAELEPRYSAGAGVVGGRCGGCGSTLG